MAKPCSHDERPARAAISRAPRLSSGASHSCREQHASTAAGGVFCGGGRRAGEARQLAAGLERVRPGDVDREGQRAAAHDVERFDAADARRGLAFALRERPWRGRAASGPRRRRWRPCDRPSSRRSSRRCVAGVAAEHEGRARLAEADDADRARRRNGASGAIASAMRGAGQPISSAAAARANVKATNSAKPATLVTSQAAARPSRMARRREREQRS